MQGRNLLEKPCTRCMAWAWHTLDALLAHVGDAEQMNFNHSVTTLGKMSDAPRPVEEIDSSRRPGLPVDFSTGTDAWRTEKAKMANSLR